MKTDSGRYKSTVSIVHRIIDAASGTFRVTLDLPNPKGNLTSRLRCQVSFLAKPRSTAAIKKPSVSHVRADAR